ncbi:LOW QUALITY PROTEIN: lamin tail domain-containing protein 2 [Ursus americanus]|uniref:LOW QUALITY PROTEIN: lamin tail domain-containing protein 2 n=1 Tax=Ursus americanus TaxID=9643 RepID=UPI001E67AA8C|nr:LOW QUALITY PROTEIN: lamin tail domain-containing protein 2 [Ursus americanus]
MASESCQEAKEAEKEAPLSLVDQEPVNGHLEPPAGTPQEPVAPSCPQDTKPSSTRVVFSVNLQSAPESLDPGTLRLLWRQRELEIQALRWAIQNHHDARHCHVLHEVAGLPPERSACNQEKVLQNQVQKLTLQLKEQKEQAQLEKSQLEERLLQTMTMMQQLEAELQAFQKSCLLQLAHHSWVGRILRSSTGSVEVVTAETLMDFSDLSESEQGPSTGEGFRLEDVDWNSIAQRYPNLFINIESNSDQKTRFTTVAHRHPRPLPPPQAPLSDEWGSELRRHCMEQRLKSVEWSSLPLMGTSSSGGADSDSSSDQLAERYRVRKVSGHPPCTPGPSSSDLTEAPSDFSREMQTQPKGGVERVSPVPPQGCDLCVPQQLSLPNSPEHGCWPLQSCPQGLGWSWMIPAAAYALWLQYLPPPPVLGVIPPLPSASRVQPSCSGPAPRSCSCPEGTLRVLQVGPHRSRPQWMLHVEVLLPTGLLSLDLRKAHQDQPGKTVLTRESCVGPEHPHSGCRWSPTGSCLKIVAVNGRERFVRVLNQSLEETADLGGLTLQQRVRDFPVCMYRFPPGTLLAPRDHVTVWGEGPCNTKRQLPSTLGQEPVHFHSRRGCVTLLLSPKGEVLSEHRDPHCVSPVSRIFADNTDLSIDRFPLSEAESAADTCEQRPGPQPSRAGRVLEARARRRRPGTRGLLPRLSTGKIFRSREVPALSEAAETLAPELLPAIPGERAGPAPSLTVPADAGLCLEDCQARTEHRVRVCRKSVDRSCPMVALSVQSTAESKYGFRFLPCPPVTTDLKARVEGWRAARGWAPGTEGPRWERVVEAGRAGRIID